MRLEILSDAFLTLMALNVVHGTALFLVTLLANATLLRRCRPSVQAAVWTVVLVKFLLPPVVPFNFGLSGLLATAIPGTERTLDASVPAVTSSSQNTALDLRAREPDSRAPQRRTHEHFGSRIVSPLVYVYFSILLLLLSRTLRLAYRTRRRMRNLPRADETLAHEIEALARRLRLRRTPRVRVDAEAASPYVAGALRPTLVLTASLAAPDADRSAREALIIHELAHVRRGDLLVRWLQNTARLVFFFWPPVWWLCRRLERCSEMACDHWAVAYSSVPPQLYAQSLLDVAKGVRARRLNACGAGFASHNRSLMAARFRMILGGSHTQSPRLSRLALSLLVGWSLFALSGHVAARRSVGDAREVDNAKPLRASEQQAQRSLPQATEARPALSADQARERADERRRIEEQRRRSRGGQSPVAAQKAEREKAAFKVAAEPQSRAEGSAREQREPDVDVDGDGKISDFEAGYSAGLRYSREREARLEGSTRGDQIQARRAVDEAAERRREIEAQARQRKSSAPDRR